MYNLTNFPETKRCVVIRDRIPLPALTRMVGWTRNLSGPVLHPTHLELDVIEALLNDGCKNVYALNPEDYKVEVLLTKENLGVPYAQLFGVITQVETVVEAVEQPTVVENVEITENHEAVSTVEPTEEVQVLNEVPSVIDAVEEVVDPVVETVEETEPTPETEVKPQHTHNRKNMTNKK